MNTSELGNLNFKVDTEEDFREQAEDFKREVSSLTGRLFVALLVGNGIVIVSLISALLNESTNPKFQYLIIVSLWFFVGSLVLCYFSGHVLVTYNEFKKRQHISLGNKQDKLSNIEDMLRKSNGISNLSAASRQIVEDERVSVHEFGAQAKQNEMVSSKAAILYLLLFYASVISFGLGILIPLVSVSIYDYF